MDSDSVWQEPIIHQDEKPQEWITEWVAEYVKPGKKKLFESSVRTLIGWGAKFEDEETSARPANHFFDPENQRAMPPGHTSPDWVLEPDGRLLSQQNSLQDAYGFFIEALRVGDKRVRDIYWQRLFQILGMV